MTHLLITVRWLDDRYHGLLSREGPPEWPPSPYRLFQALVAGVARRGELESALGESLAWLQGLDAPLIIAPRSRPGQIITRYVPNNDTDIKLDSKNRPGKTFMPTLMLDPPVIHYLWAIGKCDPDLEKRIREVARSLTIFGWGIDMAYADAQLIEDEKIKELFGVRWYPRPSVQQDNGLLRVPIVDADTQENTLSDLRRVHQSALNRIVHGKPRINTIEEPKVFKQVFYESTERLLGRPSVVFELRQDEGNLFAYPLNKLIHIAGMVRHLAKVEMTNSPPDDVDDAWVETYVVGHARPSAVEHRQFSYLPLASIGHTHTNSSVRRVMIVAPRGDDRFLEHLANRLNGQQLIPTPETRLEHPPTLVRTRDKRVTRFYTEPANAWASVTPVILPGHNDHKPDKTRKLIEKALAQSGIEQPCEFEWSPFSLFTRSLSAHKYDHEKRSIGYIRPDHLLTQTAVHLKLRFNDGVEVPGPLVIGAGRHCGFGLFTRMDDSCLAQ